MTTDTSAPLQDCSCAVCNTLRLNGDLQTATGPIIPGSRPWEALIGIAHAVAFVDSVTNGKATYRVALTTTGIDRTPLDPTFSDPRGAAHYARYIDGQLRGEA